MSAKDEFEKIEDRIKRFAEVELPETIEAKALEEIQTRLKGTPLEPMVSMIVRDAAIFDPDRTGLVKVETAIGGIEAARELFVGIFGGDQLAVVMALNPLQAGVTALAVVEQIWKSVRKAGLKNTAEGVWQFALHFAGSMAAILYGPKALKFSLGLSEVIFALREARLFQSKAKRELIKKRTRD